MFGIFYFDNSFDSNGSDILLSVNLKDEDYFIFHTEKEAWDYLTNYILPQPQYDGFDRKFYVKELKFYSLGG